MGLKEQITQDIKAAMKNKDQNRLETLRFLNSSIKNKEIEVRPNEITDADIVGVIQKLVKQRKDSIQQYEDAGRSDLAEKEGTELAIIQEYLPRQLTQEELEALTTATISELGAQSMRDMGAVMKAINAKTQGAVDNKALSDLVKAKLQG